MDDTKGFLDYLNHVLKRLGPLQNYAALYFAALFVLIAIPTMIFFKDQLAQLTVPMGMMVALALFALATHLIKFYISHQQRAEPAGIKSTIEAQKKQMEGAVGIHKIDKPASLDPISLNNISSFWEQDEGAIVSIEGTLSRFAPFIIGPHKLKRDEHAKFRNYIEELEKQGIKPGPSTNAMLSFTAGQMVWRPNLPDAKWKYFGLYQSIVRNSIPVFVEEGYFSQIKSKLFESNRYGCDVKITGQVKRLENFEGILDKRLNHGIQPEINLWRDQVSLGLYIDENGGIKRTGPARYLDGDIWVAVGDGSEEKFISRFLDLSDAEEIATKIQELKDEVKTLPKNFKITSVFDEELWERG